ncbi:MAG: S-layer homology domain-containing protein [Clostridiales bacterium]|nr:S-layer homology domain-containing protein [Clostridiales bacterium]
MKIKRLISALLCGTVMASMLSFSAFALTFPDVENDPTVAWAKDAINQMTDMGYIKGYEDGTFKPTRAVSKIETLILMSRILGVEEDEYAQTVEWADTAYSATVNAINTTYVNELSFLMYFDVLSLSDLRDYASAANANTSLLRWQAAYLMVKLAGMEDNAKNAVLEENVYSDYASIPEQARSYVAFATNMGLMNGMGNDANGKAYFSPETTLTRAQMATLLNRMIEKMKREGIVGSVVTADVKTSKLTIVDTDGDTVEFDIDEDPVIKLNGEDSDFSRISSGSDIMVTKTFDTVRLIETVPAATVTTLYGIVVQTSDSSSGQKITIKDSEDTASQGTYTFASNCKFYNKGSQSSFGDIKANNFVRLVLSGDKVQECYIENKTDEKDGSFVNYYTDENDRTYMTIENDTDGTVSYMVSSKTLSVMRNGLTANLRDLAVGDTVKAELEYGKVVSITATSKSSNVTGTIVQIVLSNKPTITLKINNEENVYSLTSNTKVKVNGVDATIYDLRPNNAATVKLDGTNVASIESSVTSATGKTSIIGKVASINTTLKVITVTTETGATDTVYYDSSTNFLKASTGKSITAKEIVAGSNITATGSDSTGYFVATIIIAD